jgi:plasmid maintenance system antidote protein VapI
MKPLEKYMRDQGLNQAELSRSLHVSESLISHYLKGRRSLGARLALRISQLTGIPVLELLYPNGEGNVASDRS